MSHEEIWDDSALVESWDDAVAEYKRYHSIHARGEKVEDVLRQHDEGTNGLTPSAGDAKDGKAENGDGMIVGEENEPSTLGSTPKVKVVEEIASSNVAAFGQQPASTAVSSAAPPLPAHLIGHVHDEGLKNLLMSWYYAGYYTGLYEGQQKGQQMAKSAEATNAE